MVWPIIQTELTAFKNCPPGVQHLGPVTGKTAYLMMRYLCVKLTGSHHTAQKCTVNILFIVTQTKIIGAQKQLQPLSAKQCTWAVDIREWVQSFSWLDVI